MCGSPDAEQQALAAFELGNSIGTPVAGAALAAQLFEIRYRQGRFAEMVDAVRAYVDLITAGLAATAQLDMPAEAAKLQRLRRCLVPQTPSRS